MGTTQEHRKQAEQCVAMARRSDDDTDKVLWLTLAQSWVQLAEYVSRAETGLDDEPPVEDEDALEPHSLDPE